MLQTGGAGELAAHAEPAEDVLAAVDSRPEGLRAAETARRGWGDAGRRDEPAWRAAITELAESLAEPLQLLLIAVGALSAVFGEVRDAVAIFVIVVLVATVEAVSEARARKALRALRELAAPTARVRRDGDVRTVPGAAVVVGDVVMLEAGDVVVGDGRVLRADGLGADESALTGEPGAAFKGPEPTAADVALAERSSMVFAGTAITSGAGEAVVVAAGERTELGRLGRLVREASEPPTPLQRAMAELARAALALAVAASVLVPVLGILEGQPVKEMLLSGLTLAFATIPEELPILVTVLLAVGGLRLARQGVLLRRLRAAEAAGGVTVVLTDKTGTLTLNRLRVDAVQGPRDEVLAAANAAHGGRPDELRDPLDRALANAADGSLRASGEPIARYPFDPVRKRESAVWRDGAELTVFVKGAPEAVLSVCALSDEQRAWRTEAAMELAQAGRRVIAVARRSLRASADNDVQAERDLDFLGLVGLIDPLRPGVPDAVRALQDAGVRTIMVTGDHPATAAAIARQAGIGDPDLLLGGTPLDEISDEELSAHLGGNLVVARATPADKLRLVRLLQDRGDAVAVTGDGVNDAPALAAADVGIAMGKRGTELAREAADLVLTDDAYPTVLKAVRAGRGIAAQLRRAVAFYLGAKVALVACVAVPLALGLPSPFRPVHIVLLELFMDLGASVAFVSEPAAPATMTRPPRDPAARFLDRPELAAIALTAAALSTATLPAYLAVRSMADADASRAAAIAAWLITHATVAWALRARPGLALARNPAFPLWALVAALTALVIALTPLSTALGVASLGAHTLAIVIASSVAGAAVAAVGQRALGLRGGL